METLACLCERARRRGIDVSVDVVGIDDDVPEASLYLLGGGEDGPQRLGADLLRRSSFVFSRARRKLRRGGLRGPAVARHDLRGRGR